jgi:hypothetical protein
MICLASRVTRSSLCWWCFPLRFNFRAQAVVSRLSFPREPTRYFQSSIFPVSVLPSRPRLLISSSGSRFQHQACQFSYRSTARLHFSSLEFFAAVGPHFGRLSAQCWSPHPWCVSVRKISRSSAVALLIDSLSVESPLLFFACLVTRTGSVQ